MADGGEIRAAVRVIAQDTAQTGEDISGKWGQLIDDTAGKVNDSLTTSQGTEEGITQQINGIRPAVEVDSRGRVIPPGVQRLPSGRLPENFSYAGKVYDGVKWTPELAAKYPDGVTFTDDGFPDFGPYATNTQVFPDGFTGVRRTDFVKANNMAGFDGTPDDYIWHHHQDGKTMQLVPEDMHEAVRHAGGVAIVKGRGK